MEWFVAHRGSQNMELYNCSQMTPEEWTLKDGVKHPGWGAISLVYGIIIELLYIPCLIVIRSKEFFSHSCFKIMFFLGVIDMMAICVNSIISGVLLIEGAVFCSHPEFIYVSGAFGLGLWCMACMICLVLVINRLMDILKKELVDAVFDGQRTNIILLLAFLYGLYFTLFTPPLLFASNYGAWFFDAFIFPNRTLEYQNYLHSANNVFIVGFTCFLYAAFCFALGRRFHEALTDSNSHRRIHNQIFLQSTVICMVNLFASVIYVVMQFVPVHPFYIIVGHVSWQAGHGCPAIIYLAMNRTIRNGVLRLLRLKRFGARINTNPTASCGRMQTAPQSDSSRH
ncbi:unnamed protein product [Auanema sp. JU1783]|nr:unnamed protein product [Auanema sp. JU1783]